jgi:23S rRNA (cytosine1962-C5)-methyltransferase
MHEVSVNRKGADRVRSGHLWIFASDVMEDQPVPGPGSVVKVVDPGRKALGVAHYSSSSQIRLRMLSSRVEVVDKEFYRRRLQAALSLRERIVADSTAYRLVFAEADLLPGLIIDRYGAFFSIQTLNQGMDRDRETILQCLEEMCAPAAIVARNDAAVRTRENLPLESAVVRGELPETVVVQMNGLQFEADLLHGQKTGIYLDQRENYLAAARFAHGRALDCFSSSGGFALHMARRCESVEAVDSSPVALQKAQANRDRNGISNVAFREANVFDLLAGYSSAGQRFSTVVLDPPAFAKSRGGMEGAVRGYKEINYRALRLLDSGGVLVTCSCSQHLPEAELLEIAAAASLDAKRRLRVLDRRTQAPDHPILLTVPETHYLKCLILQVV